MTARQSTAGLSEMLHVDGSPIGGENPPHEQRWRAAIAAAATGTEPVAAVQLHFRMEPGRRVDLDNLARPASAGLRDAGVFTRGYRGLDAILATKTPAAERVGVHIDPTRLWAMRVVRVRAVQSGNRWDRRDVPPSRRCHYQDVTMRVRALVLLLALSVVIAACGGTNDELEAGALVTDERQSEGDEPHEESTHVDYAIPDVDELDEEGERGPTSAGPWYFVFEQDPIETGVGVADDGPVLQVMVESCQGDPEISAVEEADTEVRVAMISTTYVSFGTEVCRDSVIVELDEPLGDRAVIDALTGQALNRKEP